MEIIIPTSTSSMDFDFNSARSTPYMSAPSTPRRFRDYFFSAPTSPNTVSEFYRHFDEFSVMSNDESSSSIPYSWEETPGTPQTSRKNSIRAEDDFAFDLSSGLDRAFLSAEELFDGGKIKPLKPPLGSTFDRCSLRSSPNSSTSPNSPKQNKGVIAQDIRGRQRVSSLSSSRSRRAARSLSPLRVSAYPWEEQEEHRPQQHSSKSSSTSKPSSSSASPSAITSSASKRKWRLKDFLLFRSASEGRATDKDPFKKFANKNSSFRSIDSPSTVNSSRRKGPFSAHELHYTVNKAVSEDLKKKTFLPYKQGILGKLAFNPAVHVLANGFGLRRH
ncbi:Protein of unknown function DUF1645, plant [Dillenia turbinata]|uniref:Pheromone receptor n=1 Tax=Dillenia turbinata TaxID=194707 RepID=A0AAN8VQZ3_9MAGN